MKRMKHFLYRIKSASRVKHVTPKPPKPGMQCRDWLSQQQRAYAVDNARAERREQKAAVLNDLGTEPHDAA